MADEAEKKDWEAIFAIADSLEPGSDDKGPYALVSDGVVQEKVDGADIAVLLNVVFDGKKTFEVRGTGASFTFKCVG